MNTSEAAAFHEDEAFDPPGGAADAGGFSGAFGADQAGAGQFGGEEAFDAPPGYDAPGNEFEEEIPVEDTAQMAGPDANFDSGMGFAAAGQGFDDNIYNEYGDAGPGQDQGTYGQDAYQEGAYAEGGFDGGFAADGEPLDDASAAPAAEGKPGLKEKLRKNMAVIIGGVVLLGFGGFAGMSMFVSPDAPVQQQARVQPLPSDGAPPGTSPNSGIKPLAPTVGGGSQNAAPAPLPAREPATLQATQPNPPQVAALPPVNEAPGPTATVGPDADIPADAMRMQEASERMTALSERMDVVDGSMSRLETNVTRLSRRADAMDTAVLGLQEGLDEVRGDVSGLDGRVGALERKLRSQDARISRVAARPAPTPTPKPAVPTVAGTSSRDTVSASTAGDGRSMYRLRAVRGKKAWISPLNSDDIQPVSIGSTVPGWGSVIGIRQRGDWWEIVTERGIAASARPV